MNDKFFIGKSLDTLLDDTTTTIRVFVHDLAPFAKGDLGATTRLQVLLKDIRSTTEIDKQVAMSNFVYAEYLGVLLGIQRPNIHEREAVFLISLGGDSEFYWIPIGNEQHLRTTECLKLFVSNKADNTAPLTLANAYQLIIDSRQGKKHIAITTNKNMGEKVAYTLAIDVEKSNASIQDDRGNLIEIQSLLDTLNMQNKTKDQFSISPGNVTVNTKVYTVNAENILLNGNTVNTGTMLVDGLTTLRAGAISQSDVVISGSLITTATVTASGFIDPTGAGVWHKH